MGRDRDRDSSSKNPQVFVSRFPRRTTSDDIRDSFKKFGKIRDVNMKSGFAFIEFDDYRDAEEGNRKII
jgi:RNA recognition motif-containing protein